MKIKISKSQWEEMGKKAGWKISRIIPDDGFADGGEAYTNEEMDLMERQDKIKAKLQEIKTEINRPKKIKDLMDLYVLMHQGASGYELNTLWNDISQMSSEKLDQYIEKYVTKWTVHTPNDVPLSGAGIVDDPST